MDNNLRITIPVQSTKVIVLAGLFDDCIDFGAHGRFDLLPIPWNAEEFNKTVSNIIQWEIGEKIAFESQSKTPPFSYDTDYNTSRLLQSIGLRVWIKKARKTKDGKIITGRMLDNLYRKGILPVNFEWLHHDENDATTLKEFERFLLNLLENSVQAKH